MMFSRLNQLAVLGVRGTKNPLFVSQAASSAAGALTILILAAKLSPTQFGFASVATLVVATSIGGLRAVLTTPALIYLRSNPRSLLGAKAIAVSVLAVSAGGAGVIAAFTHLAPDNILIILLLLFLPLLQDVLRFRAIGLERRWIVAAGDSIRLLQTAALIPIPIETYFPALVLVLTTYAGPLLVVSVRLAKMKVNSEVPSTLHFSAIRRVSFSQAVDFVVGTLGSTVPLLVIGSVEPAGAVGGIRLAQSLFGPVNLLYAASESSFLADGSTRIELKDDKALISAGVRTANLLGFATIVITATLLAVAALDLLAFRGVDKGNLLLGLVLVGSVAVSSGWSGFHNVIVRLMGHSGHVAIQRAVLVAATSVAYLVTWELSHDAEVTLVSGFIANAVLYPMVFVAPSLRLYRSIGW